MTYFQVTFWHLLALSVEADVIYVKTDVVLVSFIYNIHNIYYINLYLYLYIVIYIYIHICSIKLDTNNRILLV